MTIGTCRLCRERADLRQSHIIPKFVARFLKRTSATGYLRAAPDATRAQDIHKRPMLCAVCEQRFGRYESVFARIAFQQIRGPHIGDVPQDRRIGRFAMSIAWRAATLLLETGDEMAWHHADRLRPLVEAWAGILLNEDYQPAGSENSIHILSPPKSILEAGMKAFPFFLHSIGRSTAFYIFDMFDKPYVSANLAGVQIMAMIHPSTPQLVYGFEVFPNQTLGLEQPRVGWGGYFQNLAHLARAMDEMRSNMNERDFDQIERQILRDPARYARSEDAWLLLQEAEYLAESEPDGRAASPEPDSDGPA